MQRTCLLLTIVLALHASLPAQSASSGPQTILPQQVQSVGSALGSTSLDVLQSITSATSTLNSSNPSSCTADSALEKKNIRVRLSVMSPKQTSDAFGRRLGRHYLAYEVIVENASDQYQYMLHNVNVDLTNLVVDQNKKKKELEQAKSGQKPGTNTAEENQKEQNNKEVGKGTKPKLIYSFSSQELSLLRGVPEKGQDYDPRNLTYHVMRGVGSVAGGSTGLVSNGIQNVFGGAVAGFNGPFLSSFIDIFPDHTANQLNRLSDSAFQANSVVSRKSAKVFAIFVPQDMIMTNADSRRYWRNPYDYMSDPGALDFRRTDVCVDGAFITELSSLPLTSVAVVSPATLTAGVSADLLVTGSALVPGDTSLVAFGQTIPLASISQDGKTGHATLTIPNDYDAKLAYAAYTESAKTGQQSQPVTITLAPPK